MSFIKNQTSESRDIKIKTNMSTIVGALQPYVQAVHLRFYYYTKDQIIFN